MSFQRHHFTACASLAARTISYNCNTDPADSTAHLDLTRNVCDCVSMKRIFRWVALATMTSVVALQAQTVTKTKVGPVVSEVVKLHQSGLSEDLMLAHVRNSANRAPTADEIIYLHDAGVSESVIKEMILQGGSPRTAEQPVASSGGPSRVLTRPQWEDPGYVSPAVSPATQEAAPAATSAPATAPATVQVQTQPVYVTSPTVVAAYPPRYYYPYYSYPYYYDWYRPSLSIGFGFGHYWGGHHHHGHHWGHGGHHGHGLHYRGRH